MLAFTSLILLSLRGAVGLGNDLHNQCKIECPVKSAYEFANLQAMVNTYAGDLWDESPGDFPTTVTVRIHKYQLFHYQKNYGCQFKSLIEDPLAKDRLHKKNLVTPASFFTDYQRFKDQEAWLKKIVADNPEKAKLAVMGHSIEGRPLYVVRLSANKSFTRKAIWVNGGQHAREWLSPAACLYLIQEYLGSTSTNSTNNQKLTKYDLIVAPNINPDGYEYSHTMNRYWRKNKRVNRDGSIGVDLNRNWDFKWNEINGGGATSSEVYPGLGPASEPEVKATADYILSLKDQILAGIDVHTYGQVVLRNYGWTMTPSRDEAKFKRHGDAMALAAKKVQQKKYKSQLSAGLYPTSGSLDDWFYERAGFAGFTFEMRDDGICGFVCPKEYIVPNGKELVAAVGALADQLQ